MRQKRPFTIKVTVDWDPDDGNDASAWDQLYDIYDKLHALGCAVRVQLNEASEHPLPSYTTH